MKKYKYKKVIIEWSDDCCFIYLYDVAHWRRYSDSM